MSPVTMVDVTSNAEDNPEHIKRPKSDELVDIHVYLLPSERWIEQRRLAKNIAMDYSVSAGFVRVHPSYNLRQLRRYIVEQLESAVPEHFVFLRSVGRNLTQVKPKQENELRVKSFMPPQAEDPEVYLKEGTYAELGGEDSGVEENTIEERRASLTRRRQPPPRVSGIPLHNGMHRKRKEPVSYNTTQRKTNDARKARARRGSVVKPAENTQRRKSLKVEKPVKVEAKDDAEIADPSPEVSEAEEKAVEEAESMLQDNVEMSEKNDVEDIGIGEEQEAENVSQIEGYTEELDHIQGEEETEYFGQTDEEEVETNRNEEETVEEKESEDVENALDFTENIEGHGEEEELNVEAQEDSYNYDDEVNMDDAGEAGIEEATGNEGDIEATEQLKTEETENIGEDEENLDENKVSGEEVPATDHEKGQIEQETEEDNGKNVEETENEIEDNTGDATEEQGEQNQEQDKENQNEETNEQETILEESKELTEEERHQLEIEERKAKRSKMLKTLERVRMERKYYELQRTELLKRAKEMKRLKLLKFEEAREIWMKRYQQVKKTTPKLEDECAQLRKELEQLVREMLNQIYYEEKTAAGKNEPCKKTTYKLTVLKVLQEIEDLRQRVQSTKIKLKAEIELRKQAESDVKRLREELLKKKIQVSLTRDNKTGVKPAKTLQRQTIGAL